VKGIYGKPYICLDDYLDTKPLIDIVSDINLGIAKSRKEVKPTAAKSFQYKDTKECCKEGPNDHNSAYYCWINDKDPIRKKIGEELLETDIDEFETWLMYEYNVYEVLSYLVLRKIDAPFGESYRPLDNLKENPQTFLWTETVRHFEKLKDWIETLPLKTIGTVAILLKFPGSKMPLHRDLFYGTDDYDHSEEFIWFNPLKSRSMYVLDKETDTKYPMDSGVGYYWNNHDWHGAINDIRAVSWTLRVEGLFSDELRSKIQS